MLEAVAQRPAPSQQPPAAEDAGGRRFPHQAEKRWLSLRSMDLFLPAVIALALSALMAFALLHFREPLAGLGHWGYFGTFLAELGNSATVIVPTPGPAYTFVMGVTLNPLLLGLVGGLAAALGELTGYSLGVRGRRILEGGRLYKRFKAMASRWTGPALLSFALLPLPFDVAGIWAGSVRYPLPRFLVYVAAGKVIKVTGVAIAGYYGINWFAGPLG